MARTHKARHNQILDQHDFMVMEPELYSGFTMAVKRICKRCGQIYVRNTFEYGGFRIMPCDEYLVRSILES